MKKTLWIIGIIVALFGAFVMWHGGLFGESNSGIAIVLGIIGICLIAVNTPWKKEKKK